MGGQAALARAEVILSGKAAVDKGGIGGVGRTRRQLERATRRTVRDDPRHKAGRDQRDGWTLTDACRLMVDIDRERRELRWGE